MAGHSVLRRRVLRHHSAESPRTPQSLSVAAMVVEEDVLNMNLAHGHTKREPQEATSSSSSATPSKSCAPNDSRPICERPSSASSTTTLTIVLGIVIPLTLALVVFLVLHRRHVRKLRSEDANDRHKSLDFGMGDVPSPGKDRARRDKKGKHIPEMTLADAEKSVGRGRGMSMDMDLPNPYLLPPEVQQSRESLRSLSRTMNHDDDKYRLATDFIASDGSILRDGSTSRGPDDSSIYTASSRHPFRERENEANQSLIHHAQRMSHNAEQHNRFPRKLTSPVPQNEGLAPNLPEQNRDSYRSDISKDDRTAGLRKSNDYLGAFIRSGGPQALENKVGDEKSRVTPSPPPEKPAVKTEGTFTSSPPRLVASPEPLNFDFPAFEDPIPSFKTGGPPSHVKAHQSSQKTAREGLPMEQYEQDFNYDVRRLTMGVRPLPPDDPSEDPEERAVRIRSFYKEYFDDTKPGPVYTQEDYETEPSSFHYDGPVYDESAGRYVNHAAPYAQSRGRGAMTPPPRGASSSHGPGRIPLSASTGRFAHAGPRAYSSASGQVPSRKKLPPPAPLQLLPTPHMLKDDSIIPIDFAPPSSIRERRAGTPDSFRGGLRPYSPALPAHLPLISSFDDLAMMPSPHALRKSGTFTALDFAPPPRFRSNTDTRSDSGSIRSNRSGMSAAQIHSIRTGAYRVSRIPQELGGTRQELAGTLRPQWDMRK